MAGVSPDIVPDTIEKAVDMIVAGLTDEEREEMRNRPASSAHFFGGMAMRNDWSLWEKETPIKRDAVKTYGIAHADDLSGLILEWVWAKVTDDHFDPATHCRRYHEHWARSGTTSLRAGGYNEDGTPIPE